jgi:hypothetical protein
MLATLVCYCLNVILTVEELFKTVTILHFTVFKMDRRKTSDVIRLRSTSKSTRLDENIIYNK